jgi:hypothetical protein
MSTPNFDNLTTEQLIADVQTGFNDIHSDGTA